jgi:DNA mismatch repair protein MutL
MARDDALLALERHATSKIVEAADLDHLASYGFRGEALPSIASVSRFELQTRAAEAEVGTEILVNGGKFVHVRDCGRRVGTRVEVTHLFNSVPARRKFLKTDQTEAAHIIHCVRLYALACPRTAFTLIEDGRVIFRSPECATLEERVAEIFGRQIAESLVPIDTAEAGFRLGGLIGRPGTGRATRHEMIVFVNARPVDSRTLNYALIESYHESLPKGRYPLAFVFFECDPASVDVNVHPAKREIRFRSEPQVRSFVIRAVLQRLRELVSPTPAMPQPGFGAPENGRAILSTPFAVGGTLTAAVPALHREDLSKLTLSNPAHAMPGLRYPASTGASPIEASPSGVPAATIPAWRFVGLAHGAYAIFETGAGIVLLDRRATHERIWFERLRDQFRARAVPSQRLLLPVPVEVDAIGSALVLDRMKFLHEHGFEVAEFGRNFFRIEAIPEWLEPGDAEPFLRDLIGALRDGSIPDNVDLAHDALAQLASTKAVRLREVVSEAEVRAVIGQLFATRTPLASPGGRPTYIELNHAELARRFHS